MLYQISPESVSKCGKSGQTLILNPVRIVAPTVRIIFFFTKLKITRLIVVRLSGTELYRNPGGGGGTT